MRSIYIYISILIHCPGDRVRYIWMARTYQIIQTKNRDISFYLSLSRCKNKSEDNWNDAVVCCCLFLSFLFTIASISHTLRFAIAVICIHFGLYICFVSFAALSIHRTQLKYHQVLCGAFVKRVFFIELYMVKPHQRPSNKNNDNKSEKEKNNRKKKAKGKKRVKHKLWNIFAA